VPSSVQYSPVFPLALLKIRQYVDYSNMLL
jgi:hypothetical protein